MAEQEKDENTETPDAAPAEVAPTAETGRSEAPGTVAEDETTRPVSAADATPADDPATTPGAPKSERTAAVAHREPQEVIAPKERRRRARTAKAAKAKPGGPRTAEERQAGRVAERAQKAQQRRTGRAHAKAKARAKASPGGSDATPPRERAPGVQKTRQGVVVSDKADKTITVRIDVARRHRRYQKIVRTSSTLHAHDEANDAHTGDTVVVREARPLSRTKRWRLVSVLERAK